MLAFAINSLVGFRDYFVMDISKEFPDSPVTFALNLCRGVGFHGTANLDITGSSTEENLLDHNQMSDDDSDGQLVLFQIASIRVFETGVNIACIAILYNWFPSNLKSFVVGIWQVAYLFIPIIKDQNDYDFSGDTYDQFISFQASSVNSSFIITHLTLTQMLSLTKLRHLIKDFSMNFIKQELQMNSNMVAKQMLQLLVDISIAYLSLKCQKYLNDWVQNTELPQIILALLVGSMIGQGRFFYVGTVLGVTIGMPFLCNTILFPNLAFIMDKIESYNNASALFLSLLLVLSILVLYKKIKQDLMTFRCIRKRFPAILKSRNIRNEDDE
ncbi:UNKNOWN [Stylonychia lemnae]|uniref:Uncharacterized protein n=1 Tax=Stylonychia lemnae TaxID=5949 RepID=A0A078BC54_STYLE|nr:UNKNOWN [Stylonychia lemnae]|eukprot:CDW91178.1 UNKNOWN [Stylonychia lemnae]